ncbi:MAG: transposase [Candidatus Schekmanbacteria bacterium]|nr:transposase [Candidatus Schekmanbacteria bacterium]
MFTWEVDGRKRHALVDVLGLLSVVVVHAADIQDRDGARQVFAELLGWRLPRLQAVLADGIYNGDIGPWPRRTLGLQLHVVERPVGTQGFTVVPRRWVVERTFAWMGRCRRLAKSYERFPVGSVGFTYISMISLMLHRLSRV